MHVQRDGFEVTELFGRQLLKIAAHRRFPTTAGNVEDAMGIEVGDDCHILMPALEAGLIDPDPPRRLDLASLQATSNSP